MFCHPEHSEGSIAMGREMLRCAQHDSTDFGLFLEFGDFGIAELFLLNLKWLLEERHHREVLT
jgi:hypothetical protein